MSDETAARLADHGRELLLDRLRPALAEAARSYGDGVGLSRDRLEEMAQHAADRADAELWRRSLARAATKDLGIGFAEALRHPAVERAQELAGHASAGWLADDSLVLPAVHLRGLADVEADASGLSLHLGPAGLDIVRGGDELIVRLPWPDVVALEVPSSRYRRRRRRAVPQAELVVRSTRGEAGFGIPGFTPEHLHARLAPVVERHTAG